MYAHYQLLASLQMYFYTFIYNTQSKCLQDKLSKKLHDVSKGMGWSPEESPYDVFCKQNRYVMLPLVSIFLSVGHTEMPCWFLPTRFSLILR